MPHPPKWWLIREMQARTPFRTCSELDEEGQGAKGKGDGNPPAPLVGGANTNDTN